MATVTKDILLPGKWLTPTGWQDYTPQRIQHFHDRAKEMLGLGVQIPVCWNHQDDAVPLSADEVLANKSKHAFSKLREVFLQDGKLGAKFEVSDPADIARLEKVEFCSPEHRTGVVSANKQWPGESITHLAATPRPVQWTQGKFQTALSLDGSVVRLSLDGYQTVQLGAKPPEMDAGGEEEPPEADGIDPAQASADLAKLKAMLAAIAEHGLVLPPDTSIENLVERLHTAAGTLSAAKKTMTPKLPPQEGQPGAQTNQNPYGQQQGHEVATPVAMSLDEATTQLGRTQTRLSASEKRRLSLEGELLARDLAYLRQQGVPPVICDDLEQKSKAVQLSLDAEGNPLPEESRTAIAAYKSLLAAGGIVRLGQEVEGREVPLPERERADLRNGQLRQEASEAAKRLSRKDA